MEQPENKDIVYDKNVIEFLTVAVNFCSILESEEPLPRAEWIDKMLKLLPLLYLKALMLPKTVEIFEEPAAPFVQEDDYNRIVYRVNKIMGEEDVYLDVFMDDMKYSERPISATVSENIADIYQDIRNLVSVYQMEIAAQMQIALNICTDNFYTYWGQKLVNVLRPLHTLKSRDYEISGSDDFFNTEEMWD